jgi:hypothetical protein
MHLKNKYYSRLKTLLILTAITAYFPGQAHSAAVYKIDETKWVSVGAGLKSALRGRPGQSPVGGGVIPGDKKQFSGHIDFMRLYFNGQLHKYIKVEFNTECFPCDDTGDMRVLDAIAKFEVNDYVNVWVGRMIVPQHRAELSGPFFQNTYDYSRMPFYPADFSGAPRQAGWFARDDGAAIFGALDRAHKLTYHFGIFRGLRREAGGILQANQDRSHLYAGRVTYSFWDAEYDLNPGYYNSSTYYGNANIFTVGATVQWQEDGAGTIDNPANFFGTNLDVLIEKVLNNNGVVTLEGEYKYFNLAGLWQETLARPDCFCLFEGHAYTATALYLFPEKIGIGQIQPYLRWSDIFPDNSTDRDEIEAGINYVIDGHNARISLFYQYGNINSRGRIWVPGAVDNTVNNRRVSAFGLGIQLQI